MLFEDLGSGHMAAAIIQEMMKIGFEHHSHIDIHPSLVLDRNR
jgi:uncharacterized protein (DUF1786 family)